MISIRYRVGGEWLKGRYCTVARFGVFGLFVRSSSEGDRRGCLLVGSAASTIWK